MFYTAALRDDSKNGCVADENARDCFGHVTSCLEAGRGRGPETMETSDCSRIMWETRWRVEMCTYLLCVSFSFEGLPLNGNFQDNNVNVYTLYCHRFEHDACLLSADSVNAATWNSAGLFI